MNAREELIAYIEGLPPEQVEKVMRHLDLLKQLPTMTDAELTYSETFLGRMFDR